MPHLDERAELAKMVAEIVAAEMPLSRLREVATTSGSDQGFWEVLTDSGLFSVLVPEARGGLGLTIADTIGIFYELGRNPIPGPVLDNAVAAALVRAAADDASALDAEMMIALADPAALTRPRPESLRVVDGRLRGQVGLVRAAGVVDAFLAIATAGDSTSVFVVPRDALGIRVAPGPVLDFGAHYGTVSFDVATGDARQVVGGVEGKAVVEAMRTALRVAIAAEVAGAARALLDLATSYALVREQFGQKIASFQAVQQILAEMFECSSALDSLLDWCAEELPETDVDTATGIGIEVKAGAARLGRLLAESALQVHGGIGFTAEYDLNVFYKLILSREAVYGDARSLATAIGRRLLRAR